MLLVAGTAVVVVCLAGTASLMGWLPKTHAADVESGMLAQAPAAVSVPQSPVATGHQRMAAVHRQQRAEPMPPARAPSCQNCGVVESVREINTGGDSNGLGAAGGAVIGGLLGNQVGGGHGKQAMTVVGAIGGALAGNQIEKQAKASRSYEIRVHMNDGSSRTIAQASQPEWRDGDRVRIVDGVVRTAA